MSQPLNILLIEDNPGDADLVAETLEQSRLRLDIAVAVDGAQALARLLREPPYEAAPRPDLILLDLNLPKLGGREVLARIKVEPELREIPVVVLTSSDAEHDIVKSYQLGANCYVTKPVGLVAFQSIVQAIEGFWFTVVKLP
ncbi:response regulator [Roseateles chitinivorans]|uniref:Response regulator n=1 Tax=Roseateles chitinivorans TaxID=2917965 RepID=A0A2G9C9Q3_9BURK|nr:response regulator [Roseateles chitinivorans]PIM52259.1 response regulator [Roseateles chitinivorans]